MQTARVWLGTVVVLLLIALAGAGCGGDGGISHTVAPTTTTSAAPITSRADACKQVDDIYATFAVADRERKQQQINKVGSGLAAGSRNGTDDELLARYRALRSNDAETFTGFLNWCVSQGIAAGSLPMTSPALPPPPPPTLHYVANGRQDPNAFALGFNLSDTGSTKAAIDALPDGVRALVWVGNGFNSTCSWALSDSDIQAKAGALAGDPKVYGYFLSDEPHPSMCPDAAAQVDARSKLIHSIDPAAKTFIVVLDGSNHPGEYAAFAPTDVDLIGLDPYPCNVKNAATGCMYSQIDERVASAQAAGISQSRIVPVFQTFGQACAASNYYRIPSATELQTILDHWHARVPNPAFDYSYGWSNQSSACPTLADEPDLQSVMQRRNA